MKRLLIALLLGLAALAHAADPWPEVKWPELIPKHWDPRAQLKDLDLGKLQDSDPRAMEVLDKIKLAWDNAPVEPALNGKRLRIAGFAIPLERKGDEVTEFLLVPYFGACIHSPPPPANQIIHAVSAKPLAGTRTMDAVWAYGTLKAQRGTSSWGVSGYRLSIDKVVPYQPPKRK